MTVDTYCSAQLTLEVREDESAICVLWSGKSVAREPGKFILRVLTQAIDLSTTQSKPLVLDFQHIDYMNSSTITPVIRILDKAKRAVNRVRVLYKKDLKWQELSFTALRVFQTADSRIEIVGI